VLRCPVLCVRRRAVRRRAAPACSSLCGASCWPVAFAAGGPGRCCVLWGTALPCLGAGSRVGDCRRTLALHFFLHHLPVCWAIVFANTEEAEGRFDDFVSWEQQAFRRDTFAGLRPRSEPECFDIASSGSSHVPITPERDCPTPLIGAFTPLTETSPVDVATVYEGNVCAHHRSDLCGIPGCNICADMPPQPDAALAAALADAKKRPHNEHVENPYSFQKALSPYATPLHGTPTKRDAEGNAKAAGLTGDLEPATNAVPHLQPRPPCR
jgi:hypothetical protein